MKKMKILGLLIMLSIFLSSENIVVVTVDKNGKGSIKPTKITAQEFALLQGYPDKPPKGSRAIILEDGKKAKWSDASDEELEEKYKKKKPKKKVIDLEDIPEKEPIPIFEDEDKNENYTSKHDIKPLDGVWKSVFDSTTMSGCSNMMQSMIKNFTPPSSTMTLKFSKPFNPNKDLMSGQFKWKKIKANKWKGTMYKSGAIPQGMSMDGEMILTVKSKKKMGILLEQTIILPKAIAQLTKSTTTCKVVTEGHYMKIK